ncbi:MAG: hypothetical protein IJ934_04745 [Acetobacter sp.]|nr:hypothetical protein [Acetobacter sp.]
MRASPTFSKYLRLTASVALASFVVGCADNTPPPSYPPLHYGYLGPIALNTRSLVIENHTLLNPVAGNIGYESPVQPIQAVHQMAEDRLVAAGGTSSDKVARFVIDQASIVHEPGGDLVGKVAVHLDILNPNAQCVGYVSAQASQTLHPDPSQPIESPQNLYNVTRDMMKTLNVEFEYQVRHGLKKWLVNDGSLQENDNVQSQNITNTPPSATPSSSQTGTQTEQEMSNAEGNATGAGDTPQPSVITPSTGTEGPEAALTTLPSTTSNNTPNNTLPGGPSVLTLPQKQMPTPPEAGVPPPASDNIGNSVIPAAQPTTPTGGAEALTRLPSNNTPNNAPTRLTGQNSSVLTLPQKQNPSAAPATLSPPPKPAAPHTPPKPADFNPIFPAGN